MSNFDFAQLRLVNPYDVAFREARSAVGAGHVLESAQEFSTVAEAVEDCSLVVGTTSAGPRHIEHTMRRLEYGARLIKRHAETARVALLFGSEKFGLSNDDCSYCHWLLRIPTREGHRSMNLGQSVAVCLYELSRDSRAARREPAATRLAPAGDLDRLAGLLIEMLGESGYVNPRTRASTVNKVRRLVRRLNINGRDAEVWTGMLRQIQWQMQHPNEEPVEQT